MMNYLNYATSEIGMVKIILNMILCRLTNGLWLFVLLLKSRASKKIFRLAFDLFMVYMTDGLWIIWMMFRQIRSDIAKAKEIERDLYDNDVYTERA